jgi:hypothetical protein
MGADVETVFAAVRTGDTTDDRGEDTVLPAAGADDVAVTADDVIGSVEAV